MATKQTVDMEVLKAELLAELKAELEAEAEVKAAQAKKEEERQEAALAKQEKSVLAQLKAEKHVRIFIPESPLNPNEVVPVGWGGVVYAIPVGQEFEVPETIYNVWKESYDKTRAANKRMEVALTRELKIL